MVKIEVYAININIKRVIALQEHDFNDVAVMNLPPLDQNWMYEISVVQDNG